MSEAKTVDAEIKMQVAERVKAEASVLIISISTKTIVGLFRVFGNKNLRQPSTFFVPSRETPSFCPASLQEASSIVELSLCRTCSEQRRVRDAAIQDFDWPPVRPIQR